VIVEIDQTRVDHSTGGDPRRILETWRNRVARGDRGDQPVITHVDRTAVEYFTTRPHCHDLAF
jgi:hypothetical protein